MGHMIESIALERGHEIVAIVDKDRMDEWSKVPQADVAIEFTTPQTAETNIRACWAQGVPVVCGSTGWDVRKLIVDSLKLKEDGSTIIFEDEKGRPMLVWKSNFSIGVNLFFELNKFLAQAISKQQAAIRYTPSITETHHIHKLDKPSGTAKTLAEQIEECLHPISDGKGANSVSIESIREGEVPGTHEVRWDSEEDTIVITHIAKGRRGFALGAVIAAEKINNEV